MKVDLEQEINKLSILKDIYENENKQLKYEYRVLAEEFKKYKENVKEPIYRKLIKKVKLMIRRIFKR